ncbi:MAG: ATP-binding protein [Myxococcaceae bacterium]
MPAKRLHLVRRKLLLVTAVKSTIVGVAFAIFWGDPVVTAWIFATAASVVIAATQPAEAAAWRLITPISFVVGTVPLVTMRMEIPPTQLAVVCLAPVSAAILFIDRTEVAAGTLGVGTVANLIFFFAFSPLSTRDAAFVTLASVAVSANVLVASVITRRVRELDRQAEVEQGQALRLSESRRAQAERLAIVGRLASGVAHEINNPLAFVKANVGVLRRALLEGEEIEEAELEEILGDTENGVDRICQIVADLKGFSREDSGVLEPIDVRDTINGAARLAMVRMPRDLKLDFDFPTVVPMVRASQRKFAQVILNLLVNAGEALEDAKVVGPQVKIAAAVEGEVLRLTISDNGPGIPPEVMARLFEPFFTTKSPGKGTGLGLALSREYIGSFGGTLLASNGPDGGAQFTMTLKITANTGETPLPGSLALGPERAKFAATFRRRRAG